MLLRYYLEIVTGVLVLAVVLIFGKIGNVVFVFFAFMPLLIKVKKRKVDERELFVFYKAGNITMGLSVIALYFIHRFFDVTINGQTIGDNWFPLSIGVILLIHGLAGVVISQK